MFGFLQGLQSSHTSCQPRLQPQYVAIVPRGLSPVTLQFMSSSCSLDTHLSACTRGSLFSTSTLYPWKTFLHSLRPGVISFVNLCWTLEIVAYSFSVFYKILISFGSIIAFTFYFDYLHMCILSSFLGPLKNRDRVLLIFVLQHKAVAGMYHL